MERRDLDVGATRFVPGTGPLLAKSGDHSVDGGAINVDRPKLAGEITQLLKPLSAWTGQVQRPPRTQQGRVAARPIGVEHRFGGQAQPPLGRIAAKACLPKSGGAPGRVPSAEILRLNDRHAAIADKTRANARSGDAAPDNQDIPTLHPNGWLRFRKARRLEVRS